MGMAGNGHASHVWKGVYKAIILILKPVLFFIHGPGFIIYRPLFNLSKKQKTDALEFTMGAIRIYRNFLFDMFICFYIIKHKIV